MDAGIRAVSQLPKVAQVQQAQAATQAGGLQSASHSISFESILQEAVVQAQNKVPQIPYNPLSVALDNRVHGAQEGAIYAQAITDDEADRIRRERQDEGDVLTPSNVNDTGLRTTRLEITPFQHFLDRVVELLESVSDLEFKVNDLTESYLRGEASIDEVSIETAKLNLAISFVTTVITQAKDTFKELIQMQV